jgi:hypothetical protein
LAEREEERNVGYFVMGIARGSRRRRVARKAENGRTPLDVRILHGIGLLRHIFTLSLSIELLAK